MVRGVLSKNRRIGELKSAAECGTNVFVSCIEKNQISKKLNERVYNV